jgi:hypothetical protein
MSDLRRWTLYGRFTALDGSNYYSNDGQFEIATIVDQKDLGNPTSTTQKGRARSKQYRMTQVTTDPDEASLAVEVSNETRSLGDCLCR